MYNSGARGAPWVSKFGNLSVREILALTLVYARADSGGGGGEYQNNLTRGGGMPSFLLSEVNDMAAGSSDVQYDNTVK